MVVSHRYATMSSLFGTFSTVDKNTIQRGELIAPGRITVFLRVRLCQSLAALSSKFFSDSLMCRQKGYSDVSPNRQSSSERPMKGNERMSNNLLQIRSNIIRGSIMFVLSLTLFTMLSS